MGQTKVGLWIAGFCAVVILVSAGYGMGRRAATQAIQAQGSVTPAGAPLPTIQIEPIQPEQELAAISAEETVAIEFEVAEIPVAEAVATAGTSLEASDRVREIQQGLKLAGFNPGPADGKLGPKTKGAIKDFQVAHGLQVDGKVGPQTWNKLEPFLEGQQSVE